MTPLDLALRVAGGVVALAGGLLVGLLSLLWVPWRIDTWFGQVRVPVAIAVAAGGVAALLWFAPRATGTRWGVLLPALGWFVIVWAGVTTRLNGDRLLMPDDWVATLTLFGGTVLMVVGMVLAMTGDRSPAGPPAGPPAGGNPVHDR